jgi:hypothetical protein
MEKISQGISEQGKRPNLNNGAGAENTLLNQPQASSDAKDVLEQLITILTPISNGTNNIKQLQTIGEEAKTQIDILDSLPSNDQILSSLRKSGLIKILRGFCSTLTMPMVANNIDTGPFNDSDARNISESARKIVERLKGQIANSAPTPAPAQPAQQANPQVNQQANPQVNQQANPQAMRWAAKEQKEDSGKKKKSNPKTSYESKSKQEEDKSKGKKGNPFRVLMGIVGKLLDKGWDSAEIVRHVKKETSFDPKTIKKSVKIVKDYNRKEKREVQELDALDQSTQMMGIDPMQSMPVDLLRGFAMRDNMRKVFASTAFENASKEWERQGVYSIKDDFSKRSTRELVDRMFYLTSCKKYDPFSDNGPKGSLSSIDGEISRVKSALRERGWDKDDLDCACEVIKTDDHHPFKANNRE